MNLAGPKVIMNLAGPKVTISLAGPKVVHELAGPKVVHELAGPKVVHELAGPKVVHELAGPKVVHELAGPKVVHELAGPKVAWYVVRLGCLRVDLTIYSLARYSLREADDSVVRNKIRTSRLVWWSPFSRAAWVGDELWALAQDNLAGPKVGLVLAGPKVAILPGRP
jgi:hypothetical protein